MTLFRATGGDAYRAEQLLQAFLAESRPDLPPGIEINVANNVWDLLGAQLRMIAVNGLSGLLLVLGVLFLFLGGRTAAWVALGIPVSFLLALALFHLGFGYGISIIALIGLVMALGIVVDDAIVVSEDVVAHREQGQTPRAAAIAGALRMRVPVTTSSLTTMAAFIPLMIMGGIMGDEILALPTVLLCVILASLVECFLVLPGHLAAGYAQAAQEPRWRQRFNAAFNRLRSERFKQLYRAALDRPGTTLTAALAGIVLSIALIASQHVGFDIVTGFDIESVEANVEFSAQASPAERDAFMTHLENELVAVHQQSAARDLTGWLIKRNTARFAGDRWTGEQYGALEASYAYEEYRTRPPADFAADWRNRIRQPAYVEQLEIRAAGGQNGGQADITLVLRGAALEQLKQGAEALSGLLAGFPGVSNVRDNLPYGREQLIFELRPAGRALGLTPASVGRQLRAAYNGSRVQIFNEDAREVEVRVMLPEAERRDLGRLQQFPIRAPGGAFVPLGSIAELYSRRGIDMIRHADGEMSVRVSADVDTSVTNALSVLGAVERQGLPEILERFDLDYGLGGKSEQDKIILETMALGSLLTLVLIYLILAWVFESYLWPLAVMMAIPFGFTGAVLGHWATGWDIGAMSMLAFLSLSGIVVNDSIVLLSFLKRHRKAGMPLRAALEQAIDARFRAVLLTSLTTVAGLLPLMFERSSLAFYMAPIAVTICFGLAFATLLVLIVIPALIVLLEGGAERFRRWRAGAPVTLPAGVIET
jgi:multidrug efflux pump subunit AcrB